MRRRVWHSGLWWFEVRRERLGRWVVTDRLGFELFTGRTRAGVTSKLLRWALKLPGFEKGARA